MNKLNHQELCTVLAALRIFQSVRTHGWKKAGDFIGDLADMEHFEDFEPLTQDQIEALCERLDCEALAG